MGGGKIPGTFWDPKLAHLTIYSLKRPFTLRFVSFHASSNVLRRAGSVPDLPNTPPTPRQKKSAVSPKEPSSRANFRSLKASFDFNERWMPRSMTEFDTSM